MAVFNLQNQMTQTAHDGPGGLGFYGKAVKVLRMTLRDERQDILFKVLPAHSAETAVELPDGSVQVDRMSVVSFKDAAGGLTAWARNIFVAPFTGHGPIGKGSVRKDLISLKSYGDYASTWCPIAALMAAVNSQPGWRYLMEDAADADGAAAPGSRAMVKERAAINRQLSPRLIMNVVNTREPGAVCLAELPTSAITSLFGERGLVTLPNLMATEEMCAQNPMSRWAVGDLTDPARGPVLRLRKDLESGKGKYASYVVDIAVHESGPQAGRPMQHRVDDTLLAQRYNLLDLNSIVPRPSEESLVATLVSLFNQWNPDKTAHEWELLRDIFGHQYRIPEPPTRGAVQGFGAPPKAQSAQQGYPGFARTPEVPKQASVPGLPKTAMPPVSSAPFVVQTPPVPDYDDQEEFTVPQVPQQGKAAQTVPVPGDPIPKYDRDSFLSKLRTRAAK